MKRFELIEEAHETVIRDVEHGLNWAFLAESGHGLPSSSRLLALRVVDFLNELPPEKTTFYPLS